MNQKTESDQIQKTDKNLIVPSENFNINLPFFWGFNLNKIISMSIISDSTHLHPLNIGRYAYFVLTKGFKNEDQKLLNIGKLYLEFLIKYPYLYNTDNSTIYLYAFTHNHFRKYEWWSAMANSTIALAFLKGYEIFKDENYRISFQKAMEGIIKTIEENGSALELDKEAKWYLEYCSKNTNNENAYFVLNGFLYTL